MAARKKAAEPIASVLTPIAVLDTFEVRLRDSVSTYRREKDGTKGLRVTHLRSSIDPKMRPYTFPVEPRWFADRGLVAR